MSDPRRDLRAVVVGLVVRGEEILIARKRVVPGHFLSGAWHIPGGGVENGESLEQAVLRELREETGIDVEVVRAEGMVDLPELAVRAYWFRCSPIGGTLRAGDDVEEVAYVTLHEAAQRFPPGSTVQFPPAVASLFASA